MMIDGPAYIRPHAPNHRQWASIAPAQWRRPAVNKPKDKSHG
jgi:hypothetical protein